MKIIKNNFGSNIIYPPVIVKCGKCNSIILIEKGDAVLDGYFVWHWRCPCCKTNRKDGNSWQGHLVKKVEEGDSIK